MWHRYPLSLIRFAALVFRQRRCGTGVRACNTFRRARIGVLSKVRGRLARVGFFVLWELSVWERGGTSIAARHESAAMPLLCQKETEHLQGSVITSEVERM